MSNYIEGLLRGTIISECANDREYLKTKMCEIRVIELQKNFEKIKLCEKTRSDKQIEQIENFLSQHPEQCNYEIEGKSCQKWFGGVINVHNTFHDKVNIRIAHHISLSWLTPQCKIKLSKQQFEQYRDIMNKYYSEI